MSDHICDACGLPGELPDLDGDPRPYRAQHRMTPFPGAMDICTGCQWTLHEAGLVAGPQDSPAYTTAWRAARARMAAAVHTRRMEREA